MAVSGEHLGFRETERAGIWDDLEVIVMKIDLNGLKRDHCSQCFLGHVHVVHIVNRAYNRGLHV